MAGDKGLGNVAVGFHKILPQSVGFGHGLLERPALTGVARFGDRVTPVEKDSAKHSVERIPASVSRPVAVGIHHEPSLPIGRDLDPEGRAADLAFFDESVLTAEGRVEQKKEQAESTDSSHLSTSLTLFNGGCLKPLYQTGARENRTEMEHSPLTNSCLFRR